jgi:hypothetical protein
MMYSSGTTTRSSSKPAAIASYRLMRPTLTVVNRILLSGW